jgi:uncharacterized protein (TIGR02145 family)
MTEPGSGYFVVLAPVFHTKMSKYSSKKTLYLIVILSLFFSAAALSAQDYETVTIGKQTWMKHNLNIKVLGSTCYDEDSLNCEKYGRLYAWQAAINVCPEGFRLPTDDDWLILTETLGGADTAGILLKKGGSTGFDALLAGNFQPEVDLYSFKDMRGYFWTATPKGYHTAWLRSIATGQKSVKRDHIGKSFYFSVRCIKTR